MVYAYPGAWLRIELLTVLKRDNGHAIREVAPSYAANLAPSHSVLIRIFVTHRIQSVLVHENIGVHGHRAYNRC